MLIMWSLDHSQWYRTWSRYTTSLWTVDKPRTSLRSQQSVCFYYLCRLRQLCRQVGRSCWQCLRLGGTTVALCVEDLDGDQRPSHSSSNTTHLPTKSPWHVSPLPRLLHWLPVHSPTHTQFKLCTLMYDSDVRKEKCPSLSVAVEKTVVKPTSRQGPRSAAILTNLYIVSRLQAKFSDWALFRPTVYQNTPRRHQP